MVEKINEGKKSANKSKWQKNRYGLMQFSFILTLNTVKKDVNNSVEFFESAPDQLDNKSRFFYVYIFVFLSIYSCHQNIRLYFFGNPNL